MHKTRYGIALSVMALCFFAGPALADFPKRVFAPYVYLGNGDDFKITQCDDAIGLKHYTLAFIIADEKNNPTWFGQIPIGKNFYGDQIAEIRKRGGDVICSFGGEAGTEIAFAEKDPAALQAKYQSVIDQYKFTWLDFDIEGSALENNPDANKRRNKVLSALQKKNPGLIISYTLPVDPDGISQAARDLLSDAHAQSVSVHSANIMVMYFGAYYVSTGKSESTLAIASANKTHEQLQAIDTTVQIGLCPCIGVNGNKKEVFNQDDARVLRAFADKTDWVCSLSFWSMNRDSANKHGDDTNAQIPQKPWDFANVFKSFASAVGQ